MIVTHYNQSDSFQFLADLNKRLSSQDKRKKSLSRITVDELSTIIDIITIQKTNFCLHRIETDGLNRFVVYNVNNREAVVAGKPELQIIDQDLPNNHYLNKLHETAMSPDNLFHTDILKLNTRSMYFTRNGDPMYYKGLQMMRHPF
jgi:hypothetical protein